MSIFTADCAHCGTKSVAFTITAETPTDEDEWDTFAICGFCGRASLASFFILDGLSPMMGNPSDDLLEIVPERGRPRPPPGTPAPVRNLFAQGVDSLEDGRWDAAGAMFRKTLETALKIRFPEREGSLWQLIDAADKEGDLPLEPAKLAHKIRNLGNEAAHGAFTNRDAMAAHRFAQMMLLYLFTLPSLLKEPKTRAKPRSPAPKNAASTKSR